MHAHDNIRQTHQLTYMTGDTNTCSHLWNFSTWSLYVWDLLYVLGIASDSLLQWITFCQNSAITCPSGMALIFNELHKPLHHDKTVIQWQTTPICLLWEPHELYKSQKDMTTKDESPRSEGVQYANMNLGKLWEMVRTRVTWRAAVRGVSKSQAWLASWTATTTDIRFHRLRPLSHNSAPTSGQSQVQVVTCTLDQLDMNRGFCDLLLGFD